MIALRAASLLVAAITAAPVVAAPDMAKLAETYGARETAASMRLSPGGGKVLYFTPAGTAGSAVIVADLDAGTTKVVLSADQPNVRPYRCGWKSETRVICRVSFITYAGSVELVVGRAFSIAADGSSRIELGVRSSTATTGIDQSGADVLDWLPDDPDHVLMQVNVPEQEAVGSNVQRRSGLSVQRVDVNTGRMTPVERPDPQVFGFDSDEHGEVRYRMLGNSTATGYVRDRIGHYARGKGGASWVRLHEETVSARSTWNYLGFDESGDYLLTARDYNGRLALFRDPVGVGSSQLLFASDKVDVDGVLRIGKWRRPVAAIFTTDAANYRYFDPILEKRVAALSGALAGKPPVVVLDESWDGGRNLLLVGGLDDPGRYFRYDAKSRQLSPLMPVRAGFDAITPAPQRAVSYPAADGTMIPAVMTVPPGPAQPGRPAIIMPHGGPAYRDALGFDWLAQYWAQLGYVVLQPNFRGSAGYGAQWFAQNGFKSWPVAIGDVNAGARWLAAQGTADARRIAIFGWSYGGYAALQGAIVDPGLYRAVVAVAPVTDLARLKADSREYSNYNIVANMVGDGPHVMAGSPAQNADRITVPVLLFHGTRDQNVDVGQSRAMDAALSRAGKQHQLVIYDGLEHSLIDSKARTEMLLQAGQFIENAMR